MLETDITGIHVGSQALGKVCRRPVDVFLWQLFPDGMQGNFQLISRLRLSLEFTAWCIRSGSPAGSDMQSLRSIHSSQ